MENLLNSLFDFQRFDGNSALQSVINSVHTRNAVQELGPDEMEWIAAAGVFEKDPKNTRS